MARQLGACSMAVLDASQNQLVGVGTVPQSKILQQQNSLLWH